MNPALKRRGLSLPLRTDLIGSRLATERDNRLHDGSHRDVLGGIPVSVTGIATVLACKVGLTLAIRLLAMATLRTCARGIARINGVEQDACKSSFILEKETELPEGPGRMLCTLRLS